MSARELFHRKVTLGHQCTEELAVAELKVWKVPVSKDYPDGIKFSLFLVSRALGKVLIGIDNHKPKGPHLHRHEVEVDYDFKDIKGLIEDFWEMVQEEGFKL